MAGDHCAVHGRHSPKPMRTVRHHVFPQEYGGPTTGANLVAVCDTGHYNIHFGIDAILNGAKTAPNKNVAEKALVVAGVAQIQAACRPFLLVDEPHANLADWRTANDRRIDAIVIRP